MLLLEHIVVFWRLPGLGTCNDFRGRLIIPAEVFLRLCQWRHVRRRVRDIEYLLVCLVDGINLQSKVSLRVVVFVRLELFLIVEAERLTLSALARLRLAGNYADELGL